ncbi:MAG: MG2 domain-containing protein [Cystobacterineae bacterium]|nr:MG2 domain-containing protein [Cystobacterineae bacterium]
MLALLLGIFIQMSGATPLEETPAPLEAPLLAIQKEMKAAKKKGDAMAWALALQKGAAYLQSRREYEGAVNWFARESWPQQDVAFALTAMGYFKALSVYAGMFAWGIGQRPAVEGWEKQSVAVWTWEQITQTQNAALGKAWKRRAGLNSTDITKLKGYSKLKTSNTGGFEWEEMSWESFFRKASEKDKSLRGELSLLWADFLARQVNRAQEEGESRKLPETELAFLKAEGDPTDAKAPPLYRAAWVYKDLYDWHRQNGRAEEASEVLRFHLVGLHSVDLKTRYAALEAQLPLLGGKPEWARVQAQLAEWLGSMDEPARSHTLLQACVKANLPGKGTVRCRELLGELLREELSVYAPMHQPPGKAKLKIQLRNVPQLYFRAYPIADLPNVFGYSKNDEDRTTVFQKKRWIGSPTAWHVEVPQKGDFRTQELEVTPQLPGKGAYWLLVSTQNTFAPDREMRAYEMLLIQTELSLVIRGTGDGLEALVLNAATGAPEEGVTLYACEEGKGGAGASLESHALGQTNREGKATLKETGGAFFFWASRGQDRAVSELNSHYWNPYWEDRSLVFLDRTLYRPGQTLYYKAIWLTPSNPTLASFSPAVEQTLKVSLRDANDREVATQSVQSNAFGSVSGEFKIPEKGLLGGWSLVVSTPQGEEIGRAALTVAEYKRPTFEARFLGKQEAAKLNAPVKLVGEAKYYFGQPLAQGRLKWRVDREPRWLRWWWLSPPEPRQTVAQGESRLGPDGRFEIAFMADASPTLKEDVAYVYSITGDVMDEGGETQAIAYYLHLGARALNPVFQLQGAPFFKADKEIRLPLRNQTLNGIGQKGRGTWKLFALNPQAKREVGPSPVDYSYPWGRQRGPMDWPEELRSWGEGALEKQGGVILDEEGRGEVVIGHIPRGAYRVIFETRDAFGKPCSAEQDLLVVDTRLGMPLEAWVQLEKTELKVGEELKLFLASRHKGQAFYIELFRRDKRLSAQWVYAGDTLGEFKWRIGEEDRGGLSLRILSLRDFIARPMSMDITVPWDNKELGLSFSSFREQLRPGVQERFVLSVNHKGKPAGEGEAEVLGLMYDRSLDALAPHALPSVLKLYPQRWRPWMPEGISLAMDVGGWGGLSRSRGLAMPMMAEQAPKGVAGAPPPPSPSAGPPLRQNFAETAFFLPTLTTDARGQTSMDFEVPDALTSWNVMAVAHNQRGQGSPVLTQRTQTAKELMVRPYLPRFLREGDEATWAVVVNNASGEALSGELVLELFEPETQQSLNARFGLVEPRRAFHVPAQGLAKLEFILKVPLGLGEVGVKVFAKAGDYTDGEQRILPLLPSRMHLTQSRFIALKGKQKKEMVFEDMAKADATRLNERLSIGIDGQLLAGALEALPYLATYPYECSEQTFNRFFSAGMLASLFRQNPQLSSWAEQLAPQRTTPLARFDEADANRKLALEETPFFTNARGGEEPPWVKAVNLLEPGVAQQQTRHALDKLQRIQNPDGGFPWFPGGRSSVYMTGYMLVGFARAKEFEMPIPEAMVARGWHFLKGELVGWLEGCMKKGGCIEDVVLVNYAASLFEPSVTGISKEKQQKLLAYAEAKRAQLAPRLRMLTALTLHHMKENRRAKAWLESWMRLSRETENEGRFWAPEAMSWVWYNDTLENHAFTLHALTKISPGDARAKGLVHWLFLNKKLSHWRSTRTTAEVLYALVGYLKLQNLIGKEERVEVHMGPAEKTFVFEPSRLETGRQQWVLEGQEIQPKTMSRIQVLQKTDGFQFASATWHYSTERLPEKGDGDLFAVSRAYFKNTAGAGGLRRIPLKEGEALHLGEELEVELRLKVKAPAEYVHIRDVRAAGFEPRSMLSGWRWEKGYACYEEVRDSGQNYFFEKLPKGEFRLSYRWVASMVGKFRLAPASIQSMYAPEFSAHSQGHILHVVP